VRDGEGHVHTPSGSWSTGESSARLADLTEHFGASADLVILAGPRRSAAGQRPQARPPAACPGCAAARSRQSQCGSVAGEELRRAVTVPKHRPPRAASVRLAHPQGAPRGRIFAQGLRDQIRRGGRAAQALVVRRASLSPWKVTETRARLPTVSRHRRSRGSCQARVRSRVERCPKIHRYRHGVGVGVARPEARRVAPPGSGHSWLETGDGRS